MPRAAAIRQNTPMGASFKAMVIRDVIKSAMEQNQLRMGSRFSGGSSTMATPMKQEIIRTCIISPLVKDLKILVENISVKNLSNPGSSLIFTEAAMAS